MRQAESGVQLPAQALDLVLYCSRLFLQEESTLEEEGDDKTWSSSLCESLASRSACTTSILAATF